MKKVIIRKTKSEVYIVKKVVRIVSILAFVVLAAMGAYYLVYGNQAFAIKLFIGAGIVFLANLIFVRMM